MSVRLVDIQKIETSNPFIGMNLGKETVMNGTKLRMVGRAVPARRIQ